MEGARVLTWPRARSALSGSRTWCVRRGHGSGRDCGMSGTLPWPSPRVSGCYFLTKGVERYKIYKITRRLWKKKKKTRNNTMRCFTGKGKLGMQNEQSKFPDPELLKFYLPENEPGREAQALFPIALLTLPFSKWGRGVEEGLSPVYCSVLLGVWDLLGGDGWEPQRGNNSKYWRRCWKVYVLNDWVKKTLSWVRWFPNSLLWAEAGSNWAVSWQIIKNNFWW